MALQPTNSSTKDSFPQGSSALTGFHALADFVLALTNADEDGRILVVPDSGALESMEGHLKFVMLNANKHFVEVRWLEHWSGIVRILSLILLCNLTYFNYNRDIRIWSLLESVQRNSFCIARSESHDL